MRIILMALLLSGCAGKNIERYVKGVEHGYLLKCSKHQKLELCKKEWIDEKNL